MKKITNFDSRGLCAISEVPGLAGKRFGRSMKHAFLATCLGVLLCSSAFLPQSAGQTPAQIKAQPSRAYSPVHPYEALLAGRAGWAEISLTVDYSGRAIFLSTVAASDPAFANALQADIEAIEFLAPRVNGRPMMSALKVRYDFPAIPTVDAAALEVLAELKKPKPAIYSAAELDKKPAPLRRPPSAYPWILRSDGTSGQAEIEFVIDRAGRPLFPRVISATQEGFGWAAVTCVKNWRYQPATKNGEKVFARLKETVVFDLNKSADMW